MDNFSIALSEVYRWESHEYTDHPDDRGGPTKHGITLKALQDWRFAKNGTPRSQTTKDDVKGLLEAEATDMYRALYWNPLKLDQVKSGKKCVVIMSASVNMGWHFAAKSLQRAVNGCIVKFKEPAAELVVDGSIGDKSIVSLNAVNEEKFILEFFEECQKKYIDIVVKDCSQVVFFRGWMNRANAMLELVV
jgi:lysozyme family protein